MAYTYGKDVPWGHVRKDVTATAHPDGRTVYRRSGAPGDPVRPGKPGGQEGYKPGPFAEQVRKIVQLQAECDGYLASAEKAQANSSDRINGLPEIHRAAAADCVRLIEALMSPDRGRAVLNELNKAAEFRDLAARYAGNPAVRHMYRAMADQIEKSI